MTRFIEAGAAEGRDGVMRDLRDWSDKGMKRRLKMIGFLDNPEDLREALGGVTMSLVKSYNGKPVIIHKTGAVAVAGGASKAGGPPSAALKHYAEITVKVHQFAYMAQAALPPVLASLGNMLLSMGFLIQGEADDELPECLVGAVQLHRINLDDAAPYYPPKE